MSRRQLGIVAISLGLATALWRGGFFHPAQYAFAVVGVMAAAARPRVRWRDPVLLGLIAIAAANLVAAAIAGRAGTWAPALVACALVPLYCAARDLDPEGLQAVLTATVAMATATAAAGIVAYAVRSTPDAQQVDGIWRAAGTFEYPPALALAAACGLAAAFALHAAGALPRTTAVVLVMILVAALLITFDRAGIAIGIAIALVFVIRVPATRELWPAAAAGAVIGLVVVGLRPPDAGSLGDHFGHGLLAGRTGAWSDAWHAFTRRPLEGYGPGGFSRIYLGTVGGRTVGLAHDLPLEQAVEAGVVAGAGAVVLMAAILVRCARAVPAAAPAGLAYACIGLGITISGLYDFTWSFAPLALLGVVGAAGVSAASSASSPA